MQVDEGWIQGVILEGVRTVAADSQGPHRHLRAVAWSPSGRGRLRLAHDGGRDDVALTEPLPVDLALTAEVTLSAVEDVVLVWPRKADPLRQGRRWVQTVADTLRFDHANAELMPGVSDFFSDGIRYSQVYSAAPWTLPSMAALFTGKSPSRLRHPDGSLITIAPEHRTLADQLAAQGFATVGISANYTLNHENGFSAGFDAFLSPAPQDHSGQFKDARWVARWARQHAAWLADVDLFLHLQFMDPHDPYRDHERGGQWEAPQSGHLPTPEDVEVLKQAYASEVRYLDRHLAPLLRDLNPQRAVFTSDHGEEFFDHGGFRHGPALHTESVQVPLWLFDDTVALRQGSVGDVDRPRSLVDLYTFWVDGFEAFAAAASPVTMETYSFGPPRWGWVDASSPLAQWILFARELRPEQPEAPVARWLLQEHPQLQVVPLDAEPPPAIDGPRARRLPQQLVDHFQGFRRGLFLQLPNEVPQQLRIADIDGTGWAWGEGDVRLEPSADGEWSLTATAAAPFLVVFLPASEERSPRLMDVATGRTASLSDGAVEWPNGLRAWLDPGRPPDSLRSTSETLERLKALGYI